LIEIPELKKQEEELTEEQKMLLNMFSQNPLSPEQVADQKIKALIVEDKPNTDTPESVRKTFDKILSKLEKIKDMA
jgi:hypothetical protein